MRTRKGASPERFKLQLTDERGVELFERDQVAETPEPVEPEPAPLNDENKVLGFRIAVADYGAVPDTLPPSARLHGAVAEILQRLGLAGKVRSGSGLSARGE